MRVLDLFCGAGLAHRGFPASAVSVGVDNDQDAIDSFRHHLGSEHCSGLLADLSDPDVRARIVESYPAPDLVWASPPCQPFSAAGIKRGAADSRNGYPWTLDVLRRLVEASKRPRLVVIENVRGLTFHRCARGLDRCNGCYLDEQIRELEKLFRYVRSWLVNCADYGTPQIRRRVLLLCSDDLSLCDYPRQTHHKPDRRTIFEGREWVTMREALPHLDEEARIVGGGSNPHYPGEERKHSDLTDRPSTTIAAVHGGGAGNAGPWVVRWTLDRPAPTIDTNEIKGSTLSNRSDGNPRINRASCALHAATGRRRLTVEECALLQGLEHDPTLPTQTKRSRYRQVGNGVPPQLVRAVIAPLLEGSR